MSLEAIVSQPHLKTAFRLLKAGKHICADDGSVYLAMRADFETYERLFKALGFDLVSHERGFFYFLSGEELGKEATQLVVFFFVLVESWGDVGIDIEVKAFDSVGHAIEELPHFERESWRVCMLEAGITDRHELTNVVKKLERYGFAERVDDARFRFRTPAWRFFDLCLELWHASETESAPKETA